METKKFEARIIRFLEHPKLGLRLGVIAAVLGSPCLFLGFYLDDWIGRYIFSDLDGAHNLYRILLGGYAAANGIPADNHWQVEQGYAPWWTYPNLLVATFRPLSLVTHILEARLGPDSPLLQHAHSLIWFVLLVLAAARMYRVLMGPLTGGLAALLFALDHTHGWVVGFICNRHALITALFGVLTLEAHHRSRERDDKRLEIIALLLFVITLLCGEAGIAVAGYLFAYELLFKDGPARRRVRALAPYLAALVIWRIVYNWLGYGARGSGLYLDPIREPLHYAAQFVTRGPILFLGQLLLPLPEMYTAFGSRGVYAIWIVALLFAIAFLAALVPIVKRDRAARFWTAGFIFALIPAASTEPHSRQLMLSSIGAMALIALFWRRYAVELRGITLSVGEKLSVFIGVSALFVHLIISPCILPIAVCGIAGEAPLHQALDSVGDEIGGRDVVFVTAPDYFAIRLGQLRRRIDGRPLPRRWRTLAFGLTPVVVRRLDERTLRLDYEGGILQTPILQLYRDARLQMARGERVNLEGLSIEVRELTSDGRVSRADFTFDRPLEAPSFRFYCWVNHAFARFTPPPVGESRKL